MTDIATTKTTTRLSLEETREVITPFAFKVDDDLYGTPLAKSWKRATAMLVDLLLIFLLSSTSGEFLALVIAVTFFRLGSNSRAEKMGRTRGKKRRFLMRLFSAVVLFYALSNSLPNILGWINGEKDAVSVEANGKQIKLKDIVELGVSGLTYYQIIENSQCENVQCWYESLEDTSSAIAKHGVSANEANELFLEIVKNVNLSAEERATLTARLNGHYLSQVDHAKLAKDKKNSDKKDSKTSSIPEKEEPIEYSVVKLLKSMLDELGLGFGWAAFYFTVFTALWNGQTPGKKLVGIKVLQLDGTPLSMMDSFGRYGGYGAGIATGLLGFLQIMWDPNRQAIQDKISSTVVVDYNASVSEDLMTAVHDGKVKAAK